MSHTTGPGCFGCRASYERPSRAAAPGATFCTSTSAHAQPREPLLRGRVLKVQRQAFLGTVGPHEMRCQPLDALVVAARKSRRLRSLDLGQARAQVGQLASANGAAIACSSPTTAIPSRRRCMVISEDVQSALRQGELGNMRADGRGQAALLATSVGSRSRRCVALFPTELLALRRQAPSSRSRLRKSLTGRRRGARAGSNAPKVTECLTTTSQISLVSRSQ